MKERIVHHESEALAAFEDRLGQCYPLSGRYVMENENTVLVHGTIQGGDNPRIGHAWVIEESGDWYDLVTELRLPEDAFIRIFNPVVERRYTRDETFHMLATNKHWGPWH